MRNWTMIVGLMAASMLGFVPMHQEAAASGLVSGVLQDIDVEANVLLGGHAAKYPAEPQQEQQILEAEAAIGIQAFSEKKALDAAVCADVCLLGAGASSTCGERSKDVAPVQGQDSVAPVADISVRSDTPLLAEHAQDANVGLDLTGDEGAARIGLAIDGSGNAGEGGEPATSGNAGNGNDNGASSTGQGDVDLSEGDGGAGIGASGTIQAENGTANNDGDGGNGSRNEGLGIGGENPAGSGSQPLVVGISVNTSDTGESALADGTDTLPKTGGWLDARVGYGAALLLIALGLCLRIFGVKSHDARS